jgi:hypothetical protein
MADDLNAFLYTTPPNPEFELTQLIASVLDGSRPSAPPSIGSVSLLDDEMDDSTQIESVASMRQKMAQPTDRPPGDKSGFPDEPTRALKPSAVPEHPHYADLDDQTTVAIPREERREARPAAGSPAASGVPRPRIASNTRSPIAREPSASPRITPSSLAVTASPSPRPRSSPPGHAQRTGPPTGSQPRSNPTPPKVPSSPPIATRAPSQPLAPPPQAPVHATAPMPSGHEAPGAYAPPQAYDQGYPAPYPGAQGYAYGYPAPGGAWESAEAQQLADAKQRRLVIIAAVFAGLALLTLAVVLITVK